MKITAKYLTQVYRNGTYGLDDFSVEIESGSFVTVLGESGCGKTTLLKVLAGLERCRCGELYLDGVLSTDIPLKKRKTSMVFQEYVLYPKSTVWENIAAALERYDLDHGEEVKRINKVLKDFGLTEVAGQLPRSLSGGQQQRVALAKAVVSNPDLILFDEPLSNVAEEQRSDYMRLISDLKSRLKNTTFIYVTHNLKEALILGEKLLIMKDGKALQYGDKDFVIRNPYNPEVLKTLCDCEESKEGDNTVIYNPFSKRSDVFDVNGNNLTGQPRYLAFDGECSGRQLAFAGIRLTMDEDFPQRYLGGKETTVAIPTDMLSPFPVPDGAGLKAERGGEGKFIIAGKSFELKNITDFDGKLYFPLNSIVCFKDGVRTLAHYKVYSPKCYGRVSGGKLALPCGKLDYKGKSGRVSVTLKGGTKAVRGKKGVRFTCLAEEDFGIFRFAYCRLKGFDNYVTLKTDRTFVRKGKLCLDLFDAVIKYE